VPFKLNLCRYTLFSVLQEVEVQLQANARPAGGTAPAAAADVRALAVRTFGAGERYGWHVIFHHVIFTALFSPR
jgi:hypothetical protein